MHEYKSLSPPSQIVCSDSDGPEGLRGGTREAKDGAVEVTEEVTEVSTPEVSSGLKSLLCTVPAGTASTRVRIGPPGSLEANLPGMSGSGSSIMVTFFFPLVVLTATGS